MYKLCKYKESYTKLCQVAAAMKSYAKLLKAMNS